MTSNVASAVAAGNLWKLSRLSLVLERAEQAGVPVLVLKGAAILGWLYALEERGMADVDILIHPEDRGRFLTALSPEARLRPATARGLLPNYRSGQFSVDILGLALDVHVHLLESPWLRKLVRLDEEPLWRRAVRTDIAGRPALRLSAEDQLLHLAAHAVFHHVADHVGTRTRRAEDGRRLIERSALDWTQVCALADSQRMRTAAWLYLADPALAAVVPSQVLQALRPTRGGFRRIALASRLVETGDRSLAPVLLTDDAAGLFRVAGAILTPSNGWLDENYSNVPSTPLRALRHYATVCRYTLAKLGSAAHRRVRPPDPPVS